MFSCFFFFNDTATTEIYTLSLHDALPICRARRRRARALAPDAQLRLGVEHGRGAGAVARRDPGGGKLTMDQHGNPEALARPRSEEHTSELQSRLHLVCRLLLEKKKPHRCRASP